MVGGILTQDHAERSRPNGRSFEYAMLGDAFIPLPHKATQHNLMAVAGAAAVTGVGTKLTHASGALGGAGVVMQTMGAGFLAGELAGVIW